MKKKNILLSCLLSTLLLAGCSGTSGLSGSMLDVAHEGTGEYDWKKTEVNIPYGTESTEKYYSNCSDDGIYNVWFTHYVVTNPKNPKSSYRIQYDQDFFWTDDLEVFFVLSNGYVTEMETSHIADSADYIDISDADGKAMNIESLYIKEIWVRTDD